MKSNMIHEYLDYNIIAIQKFLMGFALLNKEMSMNL
jgi:hypothetical protein